MFNYLANQPDALDLANRITNSRGQQLQNAIYAAQAPQIQAQTANTLENTRLLPQQRDAAMLMALSRGLRVPYQNYADTAKSLTPGAKAQNIADNSGQIAAINKQAINALQGGIDPYTAQMLQKYGMGGQSQAGMQPPQGAPSPMMMQQPQPQTNQSPMVGNPQGQQPSAPASNLQNAAMNQDPNDPNSVPIMNSPSTPANNLKTVAQSESAKNALTKSQQDKLPFSLNLSTTLDALKSQIDNATAFAGDPIALAKQDAAAKYNATFGKFLGQTPLDPNYIKRQTYMDSINSFVQQARQTYGASIQPGSLEHFEEMVTPRWDDTPAMFKQRFNVAVNNFENEVKTFKTPIDKLVSPGYQQQQGRNVVSGANQAQQEALQTNANVGNPSAMAANGTTRVMSPDGRRGSVPSARLQEFLKKGYKAA